MKIILTRLPCSKTYLTDFNFLEYMLTKSCRRDTGLKCNRKADNLLLLVSEYNRPFISAAYEEQKPYSSVLHYSALRSIRFSVGQPIRYFVFSFGDAKGKSGGPNM